MIHTLRRRDTYCGSGVGRYLKRSWVGDQALFLELFSSKSTFTALQLALVTQVHGTSDKRRRVALWGPSIPPWGKGYNTLHFPKQNIISMIMNIQWNIVNGTHHFAKNTSLSINIFTSKGCQGYWEVGHHWRQPRIFGQGWRMAEALHV